MATALWAGTPRPFSPPVSEVDSRGRVKNADVVRSVSRRYSRPVATTAYTANRPETRTPAPSAASIRSTGLSTECWLRMATAYALTPNVAPTPMLSSLAWPAISPPEREGDHRRAAEVPEAAGDHDDEGVQVDVEADGRVHGVQRRQQRPGDRGQGQADHVREGVHARHRHAEHARHLLVLRDRAQPDAVL